MTEANWVSAGTLEDLGSKRQKVFKHKGKQILILERGGKLYALNNRCPHEGYTLAEGTVSEANETDGDTCTLTCNWHNWQFDLGTGEALVGGDAVRLYPTELRDGNIMVDITDPAKGSRLPKILEGIDQASDDYDYTRIARELARYKSDGGDPQDVVRLAIDRAHNRFEYGMSHAFAAAADWMALAQDFERDEVKALITHVEPVAHMAWDTLRQPVYPYTDTQISWAPKAFVLAIEATDEDSAVAMVRGALADGLGWSDLEPAFARAALAHYQDFGHSAIYVHKVSELIGALGETVTLPTALALVRELIYASREDLIPEFRHYHEVLASWAPDGNAPASWQDFKGLSVKAAMDRAALSSARVPDLYDALLGANAWNFLHFDTAVERATEGSISKNVGWLDFTHAITFSNAVRELCTRHRDLWPQALLQMACFLGRNTSFTDKNLDVSEYEVSDPDAFFKDTREGLFDHAQFEHIVSCHLVKLSEATRREVEAAGSASHASLLTAALNRFLQSPIKRRHVLRTANQALKFVALEG